MDKYNVAQQYKEYLDRCKVKESDLGPVQRIEMKRAFMAGFGQCLLLLYNDLSELDEEEGANKLDSMLDQIKEFWSVQTNAH